MPEFPILKPSPLLVARNGGRAARPSELEPADELRPPDPVPAPRNGVNGTPRPKAGKPAAPQIASHDFGEGHLDPLTLAPDLSDSLLRRICHAFDLGDYVACHPASSSAGSLRVVLSASTGDYLLRSVSKSDYSALGVRVFLDLLIYLRQRQFPAPRMLTTRAGAAFFATSGRFFYVSNLPSLGTAYDPRDSRHLTGAAEGLAALHDLLRAYPGPYRLGSRPHFNRRVPATVIWLEDQLAHKRTAALVADLPGGLDAFAGARDELMKLAPAIRALYEAEPLVTTHGSFDAGALLFDPLGLAEVDDFERAGLDVRLVDLASAIEAFCSDGPPDLRRDKTRDFCTAYERVSPLSELEAQSLPVVLRTMWVLRLVDTYREHVKEPKPPKTNARRRPRKGQSTAASSGVKPPPQDKRSPAGGRQPTLSSAGDGGV